MAELLQPQTLAKNSPQGRLWDTQLSTCSDSDVRGYALASLPNTLRCLIRRTWSSWVCCDTQARVALEMFMPQLEAVPRRRVLSELGPKSSQHCHNRLCSCILKHEKETSSVPTIATFTQPAEMVDTDETKCARKVQINLELSVLVSQCLKSSPSFKCNDSVKGVTKLRITL